MALTNCKECNQEVSNTANKCPHCGKKLKISLWEIGCIGCIGGPVLLTVFLALIGILATAIIPSSVKHVDNIHVHENSVEEKPEIEAPPLELQNWSWGEDYGYAEAEGAVKNVSGENIKNLEAVVSFYDKDDNFISSGNALVEYNPILSGQISPFHAMTTWNPAMSKARIEFKTIFGGTVGYSKKLKNKK